jgi:hypothetical protein
MFDVILCELHGKLERHNHGGSVPVAKIHFNLVTLCKCSVLTHFLRLSVNLWYIFFQQR